MNELKAKLDQSYHDLQTLDGLPPTRHNMEVLLTALYTMQEAYIALGGETDGKKEGETADVPTDSE